MAIEEAKKAVSTVELATSAIGLLKSFFIVFGMVLIDYARKKQKLAENATDVAKTDLDVKLHQDAVQKEADEKTPGDIVDSFINSGKGH